MFKLTNIIFPLFLVLLVNCQSNIFNLNNFNSNNGSGTLISELNKNSSVNSVSSPIPVFHSFNERNSGKNVILAVKAHPNLISAKEQLNSLKHSLKITESNKKTLVNVRGVAGLSRQDSSNKIGANSSVNLSRLIFDAGAVDKAILSEKQRIKSGEMDLKILAETISLGAFTAWNNLATQKNILEIYSKKIKKVEPLLQQIENISASGVADKAMILKAKQDYSAIRLEMKKAEIIYNNNVVSFRNYFENANYENIEILKPLRVSNFKTLKQKLLRDSPAIKQLEMNITSLKTGLNGLKSQKNPTVSLTAGITAPAQNPIADSFGTAGFTVNYIYDDGGKLDAQIAALEAQIRSVQKQKTARIKDLNFQLELAFKSYEGAMEIQKALIDLIKINKEVLETSKAQLVTGRSKIQDVLTTEIALSANKIALLKAKEELTSASYGLKSISGGIFPNTNWN